MRIGIDFDRVLFRTDDFKIFLENKIPGFLDSYPEGEVYSPEEHAEILGIEKERIMGVLNRADEFLYSDVDLLEELRDENELILVSRGVPSFQGKKITKSGICELFDVVAVIEKGSKDRVDIDFLVDDAEFEHDRTEVPGFLFDRDEHSVKDIIVKVSQLEARESV